MLTPYKNLQRVSLLIQVACVFFVLQVAAANAKEYIKVRSFPVLRGTNLSGAEFGSIEGKFGTDYIYPSSSDLDFVAASGMNVVRLPIKWERLQPALHGALDRAELRRLTDFAVKAGRRDIMVIVDVHNYARYRGRLIGSTEVPISAFEDLWVKLALQFAGNNKVAFGLMNEPHGIDSSEWVKSANSAIKAIRSAGANNLILAPGVAWTGAHSWNAAWYGTPNGVAMLSLYDPIGNTVIEVHQYLDSDSSGISGECVHDRVGSDRLTEFTVWAREHRFKAFLGEFGSGVSQTCSVAVSAMLGYVTSNMDVWMGWSWWSAGPWWGDYPFSIQPAADGLPRPQMNWLAPFIKTK